MKKLTMVSVFTDGKFLTRFVDLPVEADGKVRVPHSFFRSMLETHYKRPYAEMLPVHSIR